MDINKLLLPMNININDTIQQPLPPPPLPIKQEQQEQKYASTIYDDQLMPLWEDALKKSGFNTKTSNERNSLTDAILTPTTRSNFINDVIPVHIKVIGRHMNGSFRCHIGTSKASRPIRSLELCRQMRLLAVFFRTENAKSQPISPEFIFFPTWLLHLFRYTQHDGTPGRTDVRFLENANMAKEDHIYRLNHVLNTLFRFNLHNIDTVKLKSAIELSNFLFDTAGLDYRNLPRPIFNGELSHSAFTNCQPSMYSTLLLLLHSPRPTKFKPMCFNCNTKPASRRKLCVACYRYQLKHGEPRPLRLIVANRPGPRIQQDTHASSMVIKSSSSSCGSNNSNLPMVFYSPKEKSLRNQNYCANCKVQETHQWYRNLCGHGHWCETCKSYYLRHTKVRPPELFVKAAKRKVDVRNLVNWSTWSWDDIPIETVEAAAAAISNMNNNSNNNHNLAMVDYYFGGNSNNIGSPTHSTVESSISSLASSPTTPPLPTATYSYHRQQSIHHPVRRSSYFSTCSQHSNSTPYWQ